MSQNNPEKAQEKTGSIGTIIAADEVHDGLQHGVDEGEELSQGVDDGAGLLRHRGQTQAGRLEHCSWNVEKRSGGGRMGYH